MVDLESDAEDAKQLTLEDVTILANKQLKLQQEVTDLGQQLAKKQKELIKIQTVDLPLAMKQAGGLTKFVLDTGFEIQAKPDISVGIKDEDKPTAFKWLRDNGYGDIIKEEFKYNFGKGEEENIKKFRELLLENGFKKFAETESVHFQTLKSFCKERIEAGEKVPPFKLFGIFEYTKATIKPVKEKK